MDLREKFKIAVLSYNPVSFEELFSKVQSYLHEDFTPVKPYGNIGDHGNDGFLRDSGTYFQVYAPDDLMKNTNYAQNKAKDDFAKLKKFWGVIFPIRKFFFVINDKFNGVPFHIQETLAKIKRDESLEDAGVYIAKDLERDLFSLSLDKICSVLRVSPIVDQEDNRNVRKFLDFYSLAFSELFSEHKDVSYFFPIKVLNYYEDKINCDWDLRRLLSKNPDISVHQRVIIDTLSNIFYQIHKDPQYCTLLPNSLKFTPPHGLVNRDELINNRKEKIYSLISEMFNAYENIKNYAG